MSRTHRSQILGMLFGLGSLFWSTAALAAPPQGITLTPAAINLTVDPGSRNEGTFQILNQGKTGYDFAVYVKPYRVNGEEYTPDFTLLPGTTDISDWFQFSVLNGRAEPGQSVDVNYVMVVPRGATRGGYYAVAFTETKYPQTGERIVLNERVGEIFYVRVAGETKEKSDIAGWDAGFLQTAPLKAALRLENAGSVHYFADVKVKVSDIFGHPKYTYDARKVVLPRTIRKQNIVWYKSPPVGLFKVSGTVDFLNQKHTLPTRYVLIMSPTVRRTAFGILVVVIIIGMLRLIWRLRRYGARP